MIWCLNLVRRCSNLCAIRVVEQCMASCAQGPASHIIERGSRTRNFQQLEFSFP